MIKNNYNDLYIRLEALENKFNNLEDNIIDNEKELSVSNFSKNLINYNILSKKKILIAEFDIYNTKSLCLNGQIEFSMQAPQEINISMYANNRVIYTSKRSILSGEDEATIMLEFKPIKKGHINLYIEIEPLAGKLTIVKNISLFVIGLNLTKKEKEYNIIEVKDKYLISTISNNTLQMCYIPKTISNCNIKQFSILKNASSHCFVYQSTLEKLFLFFIDLGGRLFCLDTESKDKIFIDDNTTNVSADSNGNKIVFSYIKNKSSIFSEFCNFSQIFMKKHINFFAKSLISSKIYFNKYTNKFYIILSDKNYSNYLIESVDENFSNGESISANYSISINTTNASSEGEI